MQCKNTSLNNLSGFFLYNIITKFMKYTRYCYYVFLCLRQILEKFTCMVVVKAGPLRKKNFFETLKTKQKSSSAH